MKKDNMTNEEDKTKLIPVTQEQLTNYKLDLIIQKLEELEKLAKDGND